MLLTKAVSGTPGRSPTGMAFQLPPPSELTWIKPSSVPAQSTPSVTGDSASEVMVL